MNLANRSTADLVVLGITVVIGVTLLLITGAVVTISIVHPEANTDSLIEIESEVMGVLVGALVGFIGGRSYGRSESSNGSDNQR